MSVAAAGLFALTSCQYDPTEFADDPELGYCDGQPATMGVGWSEADPAEGTSHVGTDGDDVVVVANGPVTFDGLGGNDVICVNDTGLGWGPGTRVTVHGGVGADTILVRPTPPPGGIRVVDVHGDDGDDRVEVDPPAGTRPDALIVGVSAGAGDDAVLVTADSWKPAISQYPANPSLRVDLGDGDDIMVGSSGSESVIDGPGTDWVVTRGGTDFIWGGWSTTDDRLDCGDGTDYFTGHGSQLVNCETLLRFGYGR